MKVALLGTGFGQAHAAVYAQRADVDEVVVFGRTPEKLAQIRDDFGFATSTDLDAVLNDGSVDLIDICLPTRLHADVAVQALHAGKDVLIELPLADTLDDAARIVAAQQASGRHAFVDMFSRFNPANQRLREAVVDQRYGPLKVLEIEGRTALVWSGYDLSLHTLALDMMHADFDLVTGLLGYPDTVQIVGAEGANSRGSTAEVVLGYPDAFARCTSSSLMPQPYGMVLRLTSGTGKSSSLEECTGREHVVTDRVRICHLGRRRRADCPGDGHGRRDQRRSRVPADPGTSAAEGSPRWSDHTRNGRLANANPRGQGPDVPA